MPNADHRRLPNGCWVSPVIPMIGNAALALLWALSAFGGWGLTAFCGDTASAAAADCRTGFAAGVAVSIVPAAVGAGLAVAAWTVPYVARDPARQLRVSLVAALTWILAEAVLFGAGWLAQS